MAKLKSIVVDIDNTICTQTYGDYSKAEPFPERIEIINDLYDKETKSFTLLQGVWEELMMIKF